MTNQPRGNEEIAREILESLNWYDMDQDGSLETDLAEDISQITEALNAKDATINSLNAENERLQLISIDKTIEALKAGKGRINLHVENEVLRELYKESKSELQTLKDECVRLQAQNKLFKDGLATLNSHKICVEEVKNLLA